jgi:putative PIN family toxin of toxin-antitoxin system
MPEQLPSVVFDINVYVHAIASNDTDWPFLRRLPPTSDCSEADCISLAPDAETFRLFASPHILRNLTRLLIAAPLPEDLAKRWVAEVVDIIDETGGGIVQPERRVFDIADHEDNLIMDLAVATDATLVVSNDTDLTSISPWHGRIPILRPRDFVARALQARRRR